ncbi:MAG: DUF2344 domain-containing protein [Anaerolineae bacterium]|nr:DUF2344 domain-containing protein [Anaerolineae bacterium]
MSGSEMNESANCELQDSKSELLGSTSNPQLKSLTRHRITFSTRRTLAYVSVLELGRIWERCLRRAEIPLKYSQGYNPRPKLNFAAPLPVGCGGETELMDIALHTPARAENILAALQAYTLEDLHIQHVETVPDDGPPLSEILIAAEYHVALRDIDYDTLQNAVTGLMQAETRMLPKRGHKYRGKTYNLRPLIEILRVETAPPPWSAALWLRVSARPGATGRPDEVLKALGMTDIPRRCTRTRLILKEEQGLESQILIS